MSTPSLSKEPKSEVVEKRRAARAKLLSRLQNEDADAHASRLEKCGEKLLLRCSCCNAPRTAYRRCDLKWCPSCAPRLAFDKTEKYSPVVNCFDHPMFVTFTTQNFDARSKKTTGMREVVRAFKRLRAQRWWKRSVVGGVAAFEMTRRRKGWHPHVHALLDSRWFAATVSAPPMGSTAATFKHRCRLACEEVAEQWTLALGGRPGSVKVRRVRVRPGQSIGDCLREVMKYSITAESLDNITGSVGLLLDELSCTRNLVAFGSAYRHPALKKKSHDARACEDCGEVGTFMPAELLDAWNEKLGKKKHRRTVCMADPARD